MAYDFRGLEVNLRGTYGTQMQRPNGQCQQKSIPVTSGLLRQCSHPGNYQQAKLSVQSNPPLTEPMLKTEYEK
jgi:hypothetical protein